jgi:mannose-6-phosphate isomerase-like protein (cupin superfamily)
MKMNNNQEDIFPWGKANTHAVGKNYKINIVTVDQAKTTDYVKNSNADKYILVLSGEGIITVDTVDFSVSSRQTMFIARGSDHLYANKNSEDALVISETLVADDIQNDAVSTTRSMN